MVTEKPLDCNSLASEAAMIPFPREELTPPVTKIYFVLGMVIRFVQNYKVWGLMQEFSFFNLAKKKTAVIAQRSFLIQGFSTGLS